MRHFQKRRAPPLYISQACCQKHLHLGSPILRFLASGGAVVAKWLLLHSRGAVTVVGGSSGEEPNKKVTRDQEIPAKIGTPLASVGISEGSCSSCRNSMEKTLLQIAVSEASGGRILHKSAIPLDRGQIVPYFLLCCGSTKQLHAPLPSIGEAPGGKWPLPPKKIGRLTTGPHPLVILLVYSSMSSFG